MKILVFSDAHGHHALMEAAIERHPDCEMLLFLGDGLKDAEAVFDKYPRIPRLLVTGNCDFSAFATRDAYTAEAFFSAEGASVFLTHGHLYHVKSTLVLARRRALEKGADLLLFGHTHRGEILLFEAEGEAGRPLTAMNPGSIRDGSYGIVNLAPGKVPACSLETV